MRVIPSVHGDLAYLAPRERQVGRLVAHGLTNKLIAHRLGLSVWTVQGHIRHMNAKLGLQNRVQLAMWFGMNPQAVDGIAVQTRFALPFAASTAG